MVMAIVTLILVLLVTIALTIVLWKTCRKMQDSYDPEADHKLSSEKLIPSSPSQGVVTKSIQNSHFKCYDLEDLQLGEVLGRGHFGIVYEGQCHNRPPIALKISKQGEKRSFFNERDIYETLEPYESSFILHFLGSHDSAFINEENHVSGTSALSQTVYTSLKKYFFSFAGTCPDIGVSCQSVIVRLP
jgi:hypothetical protein